MVEKLYYIDSFSSEFSVYMQSELTNVPHVKEQDLDYNIAEDY